MKKLLLFLLTLMIGFSTLQVSAQETLTVHDGTTTNSYVPVYGFYADAYLKAEFVISANDLVDMTGGNITSMKFYASNSSVSWGTSEFQVFLTEVNNETISAFEGTSNATVVYNGTLSIANNEMVVTFANGYVYTGGNLLVGFYNTNPDEYVSCSWYGETVNGASVQGYSYSDLASVSPTQRNFIPKTTFTYTPSGTNCYSPNSPAISDISAYEATLSWTPRDGQSAWEVCCVSGVFDPDQAPWVSVTDTFYTFTGLTPATGYTAYVRTVCGSEVSLPRSVNFTTEATCAHVPSNIIVSNITATSVDVSWTAGTDDSAWEVVVVPASAAPETGTPEQTSTQPYTFGGLQDNTQYKVYVRTDCGGGDHSYWSTGTSFTTHPFCSSPLNVNISQITGTSALVTWDPAVFGATNYTVEYTQDSLNWTMEVVDGTQFMLSGLEPTTTYNVMVYSNCDISTADTVEKTFTTKCLVGGDLQIGEGTSTTSYFPTYSCYNYSYTQQIFLANEMNGPANINSISVDATTIQSAASSRQISIYMMHTTAASSDWLTATNAQLLFSGTVNLTVGWNTFNFTTPFQYDGTNNLALIIIDATGSYSCSNYYRCHTASATLSHVQYQDGSPYSINTLPSSTGGNTSTSADRCNIIFGIDCDETVTCVRPNVYVTETSENSITLDWAPGYTESAWEIEYSDDNSNWTPVGSTTTHPYEVTGLNANTRYYLRVSSDCGAEQSDWSTVTARTECGALTQLPYSENFEDASTIYSTTQDNYILCWDRYASDPAHYVYIPSNSYAHSGTHFLDFHHTNSCFNIAIMPELDVTFNASDLMVSFYACRSGNTGSLEVGVMTDKEDPTTFETISIIDLSAAATYEYVEQHISLEDYTGNGSYVAFRVSNAQNCGFYIDDVTLEERPNCMYPSAVTVDSVGNDNVTISWTAMGTATAWNIEYATSEITPGEGLGTLISSVTDNPYTIENLIPATTYYIYMQSDCGSAWVGPVTAVPGQYIMGTTGSDTLTTCGMIIYDDGGPDGNYGSYCDFTLVLYPENPNAVLYLSGTSNTENSYDYMYVYDGVGTNGTQLASYTGLNQTVDVMSQSGPLTLVFHSDVSVFYSGIAVTATCVSCYPPTNVTTSNPTLDGATVNWSGTGDSYVLFLNDDMTTAYPANDTTYTFTGLTSSTIYSVRVASICNGDTSMLSSAATFATACDAITITVDNPWTEDFENYTGNGVQQFVCWDRPVTEVVDNGTAPFVYCNYGEAAHSGTNTAEMKGNLNMLALPQFTNNLSELRISFWATGYSYTNTNVEVGYMTDVNDASTFVSVANAGTPGARGGSNGGNGNYMGPFSFGNVTVSNARIALRYTGPGSSSGWNVDDFIVEIAPDCQSPVKTSVTATNIGGHVATISWVDLDDTHTAWTVYYKETTGNDWITAPATDTTVTLTGLDPLTSYDVYVITDCGTPETNPDATHTIHFTTTVACPAPTGMTLASISSDEATITWNGTASSYNVEYGETGFTPGTGIADVAYSESFTMTSLTPNTNYTLYVNSDCSDNNDSLSTTVTFSFRTTQVPADLPYTADFTAANEWVFNNGSCSNYWTTGTVSSTPALFVTNDGTTPGYNNSNASVVSAEKLLTVGENVSILINFDVKIGGESSWDYLKVFFAPAETEYPASTSTPNFASYTYTTNAINFENYLSQTEYTSYPYKLNLTNDNTLNIAVEMPNPYDNPTTTSAAKLVFVWRNDGTSGTQPGAIISNVNVTVNSCPMPSALAVDNITSNSADVTWTAGDMETDWEIEYGTHGFAHGAGTIEPVSGSPLYNLSNLTAGTTYDIYVRALCSADDTSAWVGPVVLSPGSYNMPANGTNSITSCEITIFDDGGPTGDYSSSSNSYLTIYPETPNSLISIQGTSSTESCCDYLRIYDGPNTSGTMLGEYKGENLTIPLLVSSTGPLTLHFYSDVSVVKSGFELTVSCASNTCPKPTNLTISNVSNTSADLSWAPGDSESTWNLEYKEAADEVWTSVVVSGTPSYQLTNLTSGTSYNVRVQANCSADDQSMWETGSFSTECDVINTLPYTEDFNSYAGTTYSDNNGIAPNCWFTESNNTTYGAPHIIGSGSFFYASSGNSLIFTCSSAGADAYAALPTFSAALNTLSLTFWRAMESTSNGTLTVGYVTNTADLANSFVQVATIPSVSSSGDTITVDFTGTDIPATGNICFHWNHSSTYYSCCIDDISVTESGSGPVITDPTVTTNTATGVNQTVATLNATINNPSSVAITAKGFEWKLTDGGSYTQIAGTGSGNSFSADLTGLTANTSYTYKAFITFNGTTVYGSEMTFTTPAEPVDPCDAPTNLQISQITTTSATATWTTGGSETAWNIQYKLQSASQWQEATVQTTTYTIEGLTAASTYDVRVKAICSADNQSDFVSTTFTTQTVGIDNITLANSINLMPNPADNYIDLNVNSNVNVKEAVVYNAFGQMIQKIELNDNHARIDLSDMAAGMYFVRVNNDNVSATKKFIRK